MTELFVKVSKRKKNRISSKVYIYYFFSIDILIILMWGSQKFHFHIFFNGWHSSKFTLHVYITSLRWNKSRTALLSYLGHGHLLLCHSRECDDNNSIECILIHFFLYPPWAKINIFNKFLSSKYVQYTYNKCIMGKY